MGVSEIEQISRTPWVYIPSFFPLKSMILILDCPWTLSAFACTNLESLALDVMVTRGMRWKRPNRCVVQSISFKRRLIQWSTSIAWWHCSSRCYFSAPLPACACACLHDFTPSVSHAINVPDSPLHGAPGALQMWAASLGNEPCKILASSWIEDQLRRELIISCCSKARLCNLVHQ